MNKTQVCRVGELRPTQMMFTYGVGSIVDLAYISVVVMGLDDWPADPGIAHEISEDRLLRVVRWEMGSQVKALLAPPAMPETPGFPKPFDKAAQVGVPVATFPRWMLCPRCRMLASLESGLFELKHNAYHPDRTRYVHGNCLKAKKAPTVVPARFMVACPNGHLDDFPWIEFVHGGPTNCSARLRLIEYGPAGEARDLEVRCETCEKSRRLADAFGKSRKHTMPMCRGRRPHLRDYDDKECGEQVRAILLGASNLWFPDVLTTLAIPSESGHLAQLVTDHWATLKQSQNLQNVTLLRQVGHLSDFYGYSDEEVWRAIQEKREQEESGQESARPDLKSPEWEIFTHPTASPNTEDFCLREGDVPPGFEPFIERVVLVERLREVRALVGFTRIDAPAEFGASAEAADEAGRRMCLSRHAPAWVPATEVRGEGMFIQFREERIQDWLRGTAVERRDAEFLDSHVRWRTARGIEPPEANYPGLRYVLLHSFAHALMRQLTLECGYTAASVRERIYAQDPDVDTEQEAQAGLLIYTAAPDSEGTLGGLVNLGQPAELGRHIRAALHGAGLCASDPLCAEHLPSQRGITLHAAACHACMFAPETSCERGNKYLDRSVLVPTVERRDLAFFPEQF